MEGFSYPCGKREKKCIMLTQMLIPVEDENGVQKMQPTIVERQNNPLLGISFEEFSIKRLLQSGISPKSLAIQKDNRLNGFENEIDAFNDVIAEHSSELFNLENS